MTQSVQAQFSLLACVDVSIRPCSHMCLSWVEQCMLISQSSSPFFILVGSTDQSCMGFLSPQLYGHWTEVVRDGILTSQVVRSTGWSCLVSGPSFSHKVGHSYFLLIKIRKSIRFHCRLKKNPDVIVLMWRETHGRFSNLLLLLPSLRSWRGTRYNVRLFHVACPLEFGFALGVCDTGCK